MPVASVFVNFVEEVNPGHIAIKGLFPTLKNHDLDRPQASKLFFS